MKHKVVIPSSSSWIGESHTRLTSTKKCRQSKSSMKHQLRKTSDSKYRLTSHNLRVLVFTSRIKQASLNDAVSIQELDSVQNIETETLPNAS